MKVYMMEDYKILIRTGRAEGTGNYEITKRGTRREIKKFVETYKTNAGNFYPDRWIEIMRKCVAESGSEALLQRIIDHVKVNCVWLKKDTEREEYALDILAGRIYRKGHAWSDFSTECISENTVFVFDFYGEHV